MEVQSQSTPAAQQIRVKPSEFETSFEAYVAELRSPAKSACGHRNVSQLERLVSLGLGTTLALTGLSRGKLPGLGMMGLGAGLIYRGVTGHCHGYQLLGVNTAAQEGATVVPSKQGAQVERAITIQRSPTELYTFWREVENLPKIMSHLKSVEVVDNKTSHWIASGPMNMTVEWDAEIFNDRENEMIAWRSLPGGDVETAGSVHFTPLHHDRGTIVRVVMRYNPPAGKLGAKIADLFGYGLEQQVYSDLQRFKSLLEAGEIATIEGQSEGPA